MQGQATDENLLKSYTDTLVEKLAGYERMLTKHKYLAGDVSKGHESTEVRHVNHGFTSNL